MKCLSKNMVIALILLSSTYAVAEDAPAADAPVAQVIPVEPAYAPPKEPVGYPSKDVADAAEKVAYAPANQGPPSPQGSDVQAHVQKETEALKKNVQEYVKNQESCKDREDKANTFCMESRNPDVKNYLTIAQVLMGGVSGMTDACNKFGQVMDAGNKMLTAYQTLCSSWRGYCSSACSSAVKNVKDAQKNLDSLVKNATTYAETKKKEALAANPPRVDVANGYDQAKASYEAQAPQLKANLEKELTKKGDYMSIADKLVTCQGYAKELAASSVGLLSMAKSFGQANQCDQNTSAVATPPIAAVDCSIPANKQSNMTCICQDAPRTPGCPGGLDNTSTARNADALRTASTSDYTPTTPAGNAGVGSGGGEVSLASKNSGNAASAPGAPTGGSASGIDGGGAGAGAGSGGGPGVKGSGLNTNILGGEGGGGGSGGSWGGSGSEGGGAHGLRQYLPGGAKDPTALAGQGAVSKEVTSQGGKSNWEKVRDRYRDNKPSLLGY